MALTSEDLKRIEEQAEEHLADAEGGVEAGIEQAAQAQPDEDEEPERSAIRLGIAVGCSTVAAAIMVGGVFVGITPRIYAIVASILGISLAIALRKVKNWLPLLGLAIAGLFAIGLVMVLTEPGKLGSIVSQVQAARKGRSVLRPPVEFTSTTGAGWKAIIGWLMGIVGFGCTWVAVVVKKPALALLLPLPVAAIAGISVPEGQQIASGVAGLLLFAIGLGVLSSAQAVGADDEKLPLSYELRKMAKALPVIVAIGVALVAASQLDFLFPDQVFDPTEEPQKPKTTPLSEVEDRVLFEVESSVSGPWRTGGLDVYDGKDWRLAPFAASRVDKVPKSGIVDRELDRDRPSRIDADFTVKGLTGAVLPTLPNTVGIRARGPALSYDSRNANIRLTQGTVEQESDLSYFVSAAALPKIEDLQVSTAKPGKSLEPFMKIPDPPPAVQSLIDEAPTTSQWDKFDYLRTWVLNNVVASGSGVPKAVPPERVGEMIGNPNGGATPYEIVAAQAMLARWIDIPSRIGYGFDGGEPVDPAIASGEATPAEGDEIRLQVRPIHGASFVEVYFEKFKWLPVIGTPKKAKPTIGNDPGLQNFDPSVVPSNEAEVQLFVPLLVPPGSILFKQLRMIVLVTVPIVLLLLLMYATYPALHKAVVRSRRRGAAELSGPRARVALAYAEWRDWATDFGFRYSTDTPLMFLDRFIDDDEHTEFAWLVTRALWGDLQEELTPDMAHAAEELSRSLRRRLAQAQPATVRAVAAVSRLSLRHPYAPETDLTRRRELEHVVAEAA